MTYPNVMLDIECLDVAPTNRAVIVSVGMVKFDIKEEDNWNTLLEPGRTLYEILPLQMQLDAGRTVGGSTLQWWFRQSPKVQEALTFLEEDCEKARGYDENLADSIERMTDFLEPITWEDSSVKPVALWAKPAHFDMPKLETLFTEFGYELPVPWWCYRCMMSYKVAAKLVGIRDPKLPPAIEEKVDHNALYDAKEQVLELQGWYQSLRSLKVLGM